MNYQGHFYTCSSIHTLTIFNIDVNDAGTYRCTVWPQPLQSQIALSVTGMHSR
jgi:hypothetical protein